MTEKMIRVASRGSDGTSKPFNTNYDGSIKVVQTKQPNDLLKDWKKIDDTDGVQIHTTTVGYDGSLYYQRYDIIFKLEDLNGVPEQGLVWNNTNLGWLQLIAVFPSGIVYVANLKNENGDEVVTVYKADDFKSEPQLMVTLDGDRTASLACDSHFDSINEVVTIGQYSHTPGTDNHAFISFDGGESFRKIFTIEGVGDGINRHIHAVKWDPFQARIWISTGDSSESRSIWYSDDLGHSWERILSDKYQPTLIASFPNRVIFGRDAHRSGIYGYTRQKKESEIREIKELSDDLTFRTDMSGASFYPERFGYAQDGLAGYICFEPQPADNSRLPTYFYATGDGGETWHCVFTSIGRMSTANIKDGYLISYSREKNALMYASLVNWV